MTQMAVDEVHVEAYMTTDVDPVSPEAWVTDVADRLRAARQYGDLPVCDDEGQLLGCVGAIELLEVAGDERAETVMRRDPVVLRPEMSVKNAARVIFRSGQQALPVVDEDGELLGLFANGDAVRSQIERTTPSKVDSTRKLLERTCGTDVAVTEREIDVSALIPTQQEVHADELEGRKYELRNGLAEPPIVVAYGAETLLIDGHHRALAAEQLGIDRLVAHVLTVPPDAVEELGFRRTARLAGLDGLDDIAVDDYARHPLIEKTEPDH